MTFFARMLAVSARGRVEGSPGMPGKWPGVVDHFVLSW